MNVWASLHNTDVILRLPKAVTKASSLTSEEADMDSHIAKNCERKDIHFLLRELKIIAVDLGSLVILAIWLYHEAIHALAAK